MRFKKSWPLIAGITTLAIVAIILAAQWWGTAAGRRTIERSSAKRLVIRPEAVTLPPPPPLAPEPLPFPPVSSASRSAAVPQPAAAPKTSPVPASPPPTTQQRTVIEQSRDALTSSDAAAKEELGRAILGFVGADPTANDIWVALVNDPALSAKARQDLIEDLNESGFSDGNGRRATAADLPLIESRILLLEEHSDSPMDEANAAAFAEAYKDLVEMWVRLSQQ